MTLTELKKKIDTLHQREWMRDKEVVIKVDPKSTISINRSEIELLYMGNILEGGNIIIEPSRPLVIKG